jgi:hypothetical protein
MQGIVKTEKPRDFIKSLKDSDVYQTEKKTLPVIHLKGIGHYCPVDGKKIEPKIIKYKLGDRMVQRTVISKYCSKACYHKVYDRDRTKDNSIYTKINMKVVSDKVPYREMKIYVKKGLSFQFKITKESKELWDYLEKLSRYKTIPKEIIVCQ